MERERQNRGATAEFTPTEMRLLNEVFRTVAPNKTVSQAIARQFLKKIEYWSSLQAAVDNDEKKAQVLIRMINTFFKRTTYSKCHTRLHEKSLFWPV